MNTTQDDGGPISPVMGLGDRGEMVPTGGLSIRDWFAGMALQGTMANPEFNAMAGQDVARSCYRMAEEVLAARKEQP